MSVDGISTIGAAAVTTVGTLAVTGMALKAVGKTTQNMNRSSGRRTQSRGSQKNYNVWNGAKKHSKGKSMLGF